MMKCAEYYLDNHKVEVFNSLFGKVTVVLDGTTISEKYALFGSEHFFTLNNNAYSLMLGVKIAQIRGRSVEIRKNGLPIPMEDHFSLNTVRVYMLTVVLGLSLGFLLGLSIYRALWS